MPAGKSRRILNGGISQVAQRDHFSPEFRREIEQKQVRRGLDKYEIVDLSEPWWKIWDQEDTGSCVGWAVADSALRWQFVKSGILKENQYLSARYIWMAAKETDEWVSQPTTFIESAFTKIKPALEITKLFGVVLDDDLPFAEPKLYSGAVDTFYESAEKFKIADYKCLGEIVINPSIIRSWLKKIKEANGDLSPIIVRLEVDDAFVACDLSSNLEKTASSIDVNGESFPLLERYYLQSALAREGGSGHFATLVGYVRKDGKIYFKLRNSWGMDFGNQGHVYLAEDYAYAAITEAWVAKLSKGDW